MNNKAIDEFIKASKMINYKRIEPSLHPSPTFFEIMLEMMNNSKNQQYNKSIDELFDEGKSWKEISRIYKKRLTLDKTLLNINID